MSITAQAGIMGWGIQAGGAKGGAVSTWYRAKMLRAGPAPVQQKSVAPPEIGGANVPTGAFKTGTFYAGRMTMQPRLEGDIGTLILGGTGQVATIVDTPGPEVNQHAFTMVTNKGISLPWMGFRRFIPAPTATDDLGEVGLDSIVQAFTWTFPQVGPVSLDVDVLGRDWNFDDAADLWTWADTTEDYDSVPMVMKGSGMVLTGYNASALPITAARLTFANGTTTVQEERIIGSYLPDDFAVRQRVATVEMTYKWADPELYRFIMTNGIAGLTFEPCITTTGLQLRVESPCNIDPGTIDYPWALEFTAPTVDWQAQPLQLAGDDILMMQFIGTVLEPPSTDPAEYLVTTIENEVDSYSIPA